MRRSFQFAFCSADIRATHKHTHRHMSERMERDKILIRNTSQRRLDNQDDNDVEREQTDNLLARGKLLCPRALHFARRRQNSPWIILNLSWRSRRDILMLLLVFHFFTLSCGLTLFLLTLLFAFLSKLFFLFSLSRQK